MKIVTILGARPQFIKAGSVSREIIRQRKKGVSVKEVIIHTGQHYDKNMSDIFFSDMHIPKPDYKLGIGGQSHGAMTGQMIEKIEGVLLKEDPDWILVYGDTNSTLAGALAASKLHIKIAHIEAGLRSYNMRMPEETNRILTDRISNKLFCPTQTAVENLNKEGVGNWGTEVILSGDVMLDGALFYQQYARKPEADIPEKFILCTVHRAENTDEPGKLKNIFSALNEISKTASILLPLHPRTRRKLDELSVVVNSNLILMEPIGYLEMVYLLKNCQSVITDSGGLQKEAYFFNKLCLTLREETEWVELVAIGVNLLVGTDKEKIIEGYKQQFRNNKDCGKLDLYGDGKARKNIINSLITN